MEVIGIEKFRRLRGKIEVIPEDIRIAQRWEHRRHKREVYKKAPVIDCYKLEEPPSIDGSSRDWDAASAELEEGRAKFRIAYDSETRGMGPLKNTGNQWDRLFKTGASLDLQMGTDPGAPFDRSARVEGDFRVLLTVMKGKPIAVLYRPVLPGTSGDKRSGIVSRPLDTLSSTM